MSVDNPDAEHQPPVSQLRSKFEKLAREGSDSSLSSKTKTRADHGERNLLGSPLLRQRAQSTLENNAEAPQVVAHQLRSSNSASELNGPPSRRPPPPPPSPRNLKPTSPSPAASPLLRALPAPLSPISSSAESVGHGSRANLIARTPPPPPFLSLHVSKPAGEQTSAGNGHVTDLTETSLYASPFSPESSPPDPFLSHSSSSPVQEPQSFNEKPVIDVRRPPPIPPSSGRSPNVSNSSNTAPKPKLAGVAEPLHPRPRLAPGSQRNVSHSSAISPVTKIDNLNSLHRHSISTIETNAAPVLRTPPPLPSRQSTIGAEKKHTNGIDNGSPPTLSKPKLPGPGETAQPRRPTIQPPPVRFAPRHSNSLAFSSDSAISSPKSETSPSSAVLTLQPPPRLPVRRSPPPTLSELTNSKVPRPPVRAATFHDGDPHHGTASAPPVMERKIVGSGSIAPPPTRTIALGDKLPPAKLHLNHGDGSTSDSADEDEQSGKSSRSVDLLPDASNSSRRLPLLSASEFRHTHPHVAAHVGVIAIAGSVVAIAQNHVKIYDFSRSDAPLYTVDMRDAELEWRVKEPRVSSMEFRNAIQPSDRGRYLWLGTRDGHLWELDVHTGMTCGTRPVAHSGAVTHIFRQGNAMVTVDESGKTLVFEPEQEGIDMLLSHTQPRVIRIADKQGFAEMLGGNLWTSGGPGSGSANAAQTNGASVSKGPIVRVYDVMVPGSAPKSLFPLEHVGSVTSGTVLHTHPHNVYLGHEGGFISVWNVATSDGTPECIEVVKISASDVLCLEGVNDRLWAGGRKGTITAYDIEYKPWTFTNCWMAHSELPVHTLFVDPLSIEKCGQLTVVSVGRDEQAKFWDGLLGVDWIESEVTKRETAYSSYRPLDVLIVSWNVDAAKPDALNGCPENFNFLNDVLHSVESPDIIAFGFQELIDLESRKMAAKTVLLGGKKKSADGSISEKVSRSYKMWHDRLIKAVRLAMPPDCPYTVLHTENLVGLFSCIFVKHSMKMSVTDTAIASIKRGIGGRYGNKGGIIARFVIDDSSICFINCHLAAGQHHVRARGADAAAMLEEKELFAPSLTNLEPVAYVGGGDGSMVLDHEIVFLNGDLNYRIDQRRETVVSSIRAGDFNQLLAHDQLLKEMKFNRGFRLRSFVEAPITFAPTYKYDRRSSEYDSSQKSRVPAWCDRILYKCRHPTRVQLLHYHRYEANVSDHRPISAGFRITVKSVSPGQRAQVKTEVENLWVERQQSLLSGLRSFYTSILAV